MDNNIPKLKKLQVVCLFPLCVVLRNLFQLSASGKGETHSSSFTFYLNLSKSSWNWRNYVIYSTQTASHSSYL